MRFAPLAQLRSTQPTSHLQAYGAADGLDAAVARGEQVSYRMRTEARAGGLRGSSGAGSDPDSGERERRGQLRRIQPIATVLRDAKGAARHSALNSIIGYKVYGKALLGVDEVVTRVVFRAGEW
jgi:hypothetical protein